MAEPWDDDDFGWFGDTPPPPGATAPAASATGETDWAAIVASALGGTAEIISAAVGGGSAPKTTAPTLDPFGPKKSTGVPVWVWAAVGLGGLVLLSRRGR